MTKQVFGFCGTDVKIKLWNFRETKECPLCNEMEDSHHVLHCKSKAASDKWEDSINILEESFK